MTLTIEHLEALCRVAETPERLAADPLGLVPRAGSPAGRELSGFMAAGLAFGNVASIRKSVKDVLSALDKPKHLARTGHRWVRGADIVAVVDRIRALQSKHGSLGGAFMAGYVPGDMRQSLDAFSVRIREDLPKTRGAYYLCPSPQGGSPCKRLNLFMRWMVRTEGFDLGLWRGVSPADLIMPIDVHVMRFARRFGLTRRKTPSWQMACEITDALKALTPDDPLRYDFAIAHAGMLGSGSTQ